MNYEKTLKQKEYYLKNKEKLALKRKEYVLKNKEKVALKNKEYYLKNKEKVALQKNEYYLKNKEKKKSSCIYIVKEQIPIQLKRIPVAVLIKRF